MRRAPIRRPKTAVSHRVRPNMAFERDASGEAPLNFTLYKEEPKMIRGSCGCGAIKFELSSVPNMMGTCHCSQCRKAGSNTIVFVNKDSFRLAQGREFISRYESGIYTRCFCKKCGTALGEIELQEDSFPIAANCFDDDPIVRNLFHGFVASKPAWYEICDNAKQFPEHPTQS